MKKFSIGVALALAFTAQSAYAQAYYQTPATYSYGSCVSIGRDLTVGSTGTDVLSLQQFIVSRNYPGGGSWMLTSHFGSATRAGVMDFQIDMHIPQTGIVDAQTRAALSSVTCGNSYVQQPISQPTYNYTTPWYNYNTYTYGNNYSGNCSLVYNSTSNCGCSSALNTSYPYNTSYQYNTYPYNSYNYNNCGTPSNGALSVSYLSPQSGPVGTVVTVYGSGFTAQNNSIKFGSGIIANLSSVDGQTLTFTVPSTLTGFGTSIVSQGNYDVSVTNGNGTTSNFIPFNVTYGNVNNSNAPVISNVSGPTSLSVNTTGTWQVSISNQYYQYNNTYNTISVNWGDPVYGAYLAAPQQIYGNGTQTATFTHAYAQSGTYTVTFTVSNGVGSNTSTITVNVGNGYNNNGNTPAISYITPSYGSVGSQIQIVGSGFNGDNTVHFGNGGQMHLTSASGNYIYFVIPSTITPCTVQSNGNTGCPQYAQQVTSGQYPIYITTNGVNSNTLTYTVQ